MLEERRFRTTLAISADSPEQLRACDVDRVLSEACYLGPEYVSGFTDWLLQQQLSEQTRQEVTEWTPL